MRKRSIALFLVLALMLSLCAVSAVAGEEPEETTETAETTETTDGETGVETKSPVRTVKKPKRSPSIWPAPTLRKRNLRRRGVPLMRRHKSFLEK